MSPLANTVAIMALPFLLASAAKSELPDETSLVQLAGKLLDRSSATGAAEYKPADDFKPLPQNQTKIDEAMKRKAAASGVPLTRHRIKQNKTDKEAPEAAPGFPTTAPNAPNAGTAAPTAAPQAGSSPFGHPAAKEVIDQDRKAEEKAEKDMKQKVESGAADEPVTKHETKEEDKVKTAPSATPKENREEAMQAAIAQQDLEALEKAEAEKNQAMYAAAAAAASEDAIAVQLANQARKLAQANKAGLPKGKLEKQLAESIEKEIEAEMAELQVRSDIEKRALLDAEAKVDAAEVAARKVAKDAQKEAVMKAEGK